GQARQGVDYIARGAGFSIYLSPASATLTIANAPMPAKEGRPRVDALRINFDGANRNAIASARDRLPGVSNYYVGSDPAHWHRAVPTFARVEYRSAYPGIDLAYHGQTGRIEFDFDLAPYADPSRIVMSVDGDVGVNRDGDAVIGAGGNSIAMRKPNAWQMLNGVRQPVDVRYRVAGHNKLALAVGEYDRTRPLTIDPIVIRYSSYVGGSAAEANAIAIDSNDNAYIVGWAADDCAKCSTPFPTTTGPAYAGGTADAFVLALNSTGTAVIYSTLIGGSNYDPATSIAVDSSAAAYVAGYTQSSDFATPTNTTAYGGNGDGWVAKFDSAGALQWARYIGGSSVDSAASIALPQGCTAPCAPIVAGFTDSANFPVSHGSFVGKEDAWVGQVASDGSAMTFTTLLGGSHRARATGVAADGGGSIYLSGSTDTANFPSDLSAPPGTFGGTSDAFVLKLNSTGTTVDYRTFLGGGGFDEGTGIALLPGCAGNCNAYVVGTTLSPDFPLSVGTIPQRNFAGVADLFVAEVDSGGSTIYATFLGGAAGINLAASNGIAVDSSGDAFVTGQTSSTTFPTSADKVEGPSLNPNGNLFASTDDFTTLAGTNWVSSNGAPISGDHNGATQYIGSTAGLFSSADGVHFSKLAATGLPAGAVTAVHYEAGLTPNVLFAGTPTGLYLSTDGGSTFSATGLGSHPVTLVADLLAKKSPTLANTQVFAGTTDEGLQFSGKNQTTFVPCGGLVPANDFEVFSITRDNVSGVVLAATNRGVFSSTDVGTATPPSFTPTSFNFDAVFSMDADKTQSVIYAGTLNDGVWLSMDDATFTKATIARPNPSVFALGHDGGTVPTTILAGVTSQYESTVFVSADKGMTFNESITGIDDFGGSLKAMNSNFVGISQQADAIVTEINPSGSAITFSSYLGGPSFDAGSGIAVDSNSNIFLTGVTFSSTAFPIEPQPGAEQPNFGGLVNGYAARIGMSALATGTATATATSTSSGSPTPTATGATSTPTATATATATASPSVTATPTATPTMVPEKPTIKPKKLKFGKVKSNTISKSKNVSISLKKSKTAVPVLIFTPAISAGYALVNNCPASLAPGGKCKMSVTFKPMTTGPANGSLTIFFNGIGSPVTVSLTGTGD
ncbi:MAG TPA: SBBP repeat-containing protein, partial [Patescibacteria group bacterium]|nr:SBBP repeat-containing protein [Patescibacteria group bacterium]